MAERDEKFDEIANQLNENILAVKGTLELIDTSVEEDDLHQLLLKAINRMDIIQGISDEMLAVLKSCFDKMGDTRE
jgi:hypothetical protein